MSLPFATIETAEPPAWEDTDAVALRNFLKTPAGEKLRAIAMHAEQACNRQAVLGGPPFEQRAGYAQGWHRATAYFFDTLTADVRPKQDDDTEEGAEASPLRERLAP